MDSESKLNQPETLLSDVRTRIDQVDSEILELLASRQKLSTEVVSIKDANGLALRNEQRERELLRERIQSGREKGLDPQLVTNVFHQVIASSVRSQNDFLQNKMAEQAVAKLGLKLGHGDLKIAFQGIDGSHSHLAGRSFFHCSTAGKPSTVSFFGCPSFEEVVRAVEREVCQIGLLPIENTSSGAFNDVYDLLLNSRVSIVGEEIFKMNHTLIGMPNANVLHLTKILCSPLAITECRKFLSSIPACKIEYCADSALAVKQVREYGDPHIAAIANDEVATLFNLEVLKRGVANTESSFTRYLVISRTPIEVDPRVPSKTSVVIHTTNQAGALANALNVFRDHAINLTKLESRPVPGDSWEEMFYIDFIGNSGSEAVKAALADLSKVVRFIKVLGCYPQCVVEPTAVRLDSVVAPTAHVQTDAKSEAPAPKAKTTTGPVKDKGYTLVTKEHKPEKTVITLGNIKIGGGNFVVIAGPCSVESHEQIISCARHARDNGAVILRGGVFKPRTSPYSFQGLGYEGLDLLVEAGRQFGMPVITEVMTTEDVERVAEKADIIQIGARNMQNFSLLKAVGQIRRPVMLKRGLSSSIEELLQATEYILSGGNQQVFLCERGIRTFETATRGTLDLSAVPVLKQRTHLPIFVDPSHAAGVRDLVSPLALAAKAVGADGIIVEFHPEPEKALSDGPQALRFHQFEKLMQDLKQIPQLSTN